MSGSKETIETFRDVRGYWLKEATRDEPFCFNSSVSFRRYRITVEVIDEPQEVLQERVKKLMVENDNPHNWRALETAGISCGMTPEECCEYIRRKPA